MNRCLNRPTLSHQPSTLTTTLVLATTNLAVFYLLNAKDEMLDWMKLPKNIGEETSETEDYCDETRGCEQLLRKGG